MENTMRIAATPSKLAIATALSLAIGTVRCHMPGTPNATILHYNP